MATWFVRETGDDTTGNGTISAPYRTVGKALMVWSSNDTVDVGTGSFTETGWNSGTFTTGTIRGKGYKRTKIISLADSSGPASLVRVSFVTARLLIQELSIEQVSLGVPIANFVSGGMDCRVIFARVLFLLRDSYAVRLAGTTPSLKVQILNCVVKGVDQTNKLAKALVGDRKDQIVVRNSIFVDLAEVVSADATGKPQDLNFNAYLRNDRVLLVEGGGEQSVYDKDPGFVRYDQNDLTLKSGSPLEGSGTDLNLGFGDPLELPPTELNWLFSGENPSIGLEEIVKPQGSSIASNFNLHLLIQVFAEQFESIIKDFDVIRRSRFVELANSRDINLRWGTLLGAFRPSSMTEEDYRSFITQLMDLIFDFAPAYVASERLIQLLFPGQNIGKFEYHNTRRFPLGTALKLQVKTPTPSLTVTLTAGLFQLERRWYRVLQQDVLCVANNTTHFYCEADDTTTDSLIVNVQHTTASNGAEFGYKNEPLTGSLVFTKGSTTVIGIGTLFTSEIKIDIRRIRLSGTDFYYNVDEIKSDLELTIRTAFVSETISGAGEVAKPVRYIGFVVTNGSTVTDIRNEGMLGRTTYSNSPQSKGHGYDLVVGAVDPFDATSERVALLLPLLCKVKAVHKLGFLMDVVSYYSSQAPAGVLICRELQPFVQSTVDYLEDWESSSWPLF